MDIEERTSLRKSLSTWCARSRDQLEEIETQTLDATGWRRLYDALDDLGVLHLCFEPEARHELANVAEAAHCLAAHSPSLAQLVVQQNLAARLLGDAGAARPAGWVALPLYDSAAEWPEQVSVTVTRLGHRVDGCWRSIPGLPVASSAILPLATTRGDFALARIDFAVAHAGVALGPTARTLGLRGCPMADLECAGAVLNGGAILREGATARRSVEALWSQAEVLTQAIRAGILERCYAVAREYAATRWQGQKLIADHSLIQRLLAELYGARCAIESSWRDMGASLVADQPLSAGQMSTSLKFASDVPRLASDGIQLLGGYGYMEEYGQERLFRDAKQCEMLLGHPRAKSLSIWRQEPR